MTQIEELLVDSSRVIADMIIAKIGGQQEEFNEVVTIMRKDKYPMAMRAARIIQILGIKHPNLVRPHIAELLLMIKKTRIDGVRRSLLKLFSEAPLHIKEDQWGELADMAFEYADDRKQPIAVRNFAIDIIMKTITVYPELKPEFIAVLESVNIDGSAGLKNKCKKLLKKLNERW